MAEEPAGGEVSRGGGETPAKDGEHRLPPTRGGGGGAAGAPRGTDLLTGAGARPALPACLDGAVPRGVQRRPRMAGGGGGGCLRVGVLIPSSHPHSHSREHLVPPSPPPPPPPGVCGLFTGGFGFFKHHHPTPPPPPPLFWLCVVVGTHRRVCGKGHASCHGAA